MTDARDTPDETPDDTRDTLLAGQYEAYPYPARDARDEAKRLIVGSPSHLREIDHWAFGAARPQRRPLRALFAGGGTGDGTIMLAQQMARLGRAGQVTHLDRSGAAQAVARARAEARGLAVRFRQGSLLDLPGSGAGSEDEYDYIDCCGVLHHLPDPGAGLRALLSVLAPGGAMGLMVYAPHGRTGVYMLQDALRRLAPLGMPAAARLDVARRVMRHLPATAWLRGNGYFADHIDGGDAGLFDLLLNPRDRAYNVSAFDALLRLEKLTITCFMEPLRYDPAILLPDPRLRSRLEGLSLIERAGLAEDLAGNMSTHVVYVTRAGEEPAVPDPMRDDAVPVAREMPAAEIARGIRPDGTLPFVFDGLRVPVAVPPLASAILRLVDGVRSVGAIGAELAARGTSEAAFRRAWRQTFDALSATNRILLAAPP